jgi:hypothetical protein
MTRRVGDVPSWWLELAQTWRASDMLELLDRVTAAGVSKNDRTAVERIWRDLRIARVAGERNP